MEGSANRSLPFLITIITVFSLRLPCSAQQPDAKSILLGAAAALERHNSVEYTATMKFKFFSQQDTFVCRGIAKLIRVPSDTVWGCKFLYTTIGDTLMRDEVSWLYDLNLAYALNSKSESGTSYDPYKGETWAIESDIRDGLRWKNFIIPKRVGDKAKDSLSFSGTHTIEGIPCYEVKVIMPDEGTGNDATKQTTWIYVSQKDSIPIFQKWVLTYQGEQQYNELMIHRYDFDTIEDISLSSFTRVPYTISPYKQDSSRFKTLDSGAIAPIFSGKIYQHKLDSTTISYKDKVTLLDFWYQDCPWCIKAFPQIEKINDKYKGSAFQLIGVDNVDNTDKNIKRLPNFLSYNQMSYNTLLVTDDIPKKFLLKGCPSYYLIDKNGTIVFSQVGYSDDLYDTLDKKISQLLK
jgi:thiol-disulfide isomerase/thioredoxin